MFANVQQHVRYIIERAYATMQTGPVRQVGQDGMSREAFLAFLAHDLAQTAERHTITTTHVP